MSPFVYFVTVENKTRQQINTHACQSSSPNFPPLSILVLSFKFYGIYVKYHPLQDLPGMLTPVCDIMLLPQIGVNPQILHWKEFLLCVSHSILSTNSPQEKSASWRGHEAGIGCLTR